MDNNLAAVAASTASSAGLFSPAIVETIKSGILYIGGLGAALIVAFAGIRKALKDLAKGDDPKQPGGRHPAAANIIGGTIMETTTLLMWSESNREVAEKAGDVVDAINNNTAAIKENNRETAELRHQVERLRDKMP
jgi:hypothetical protein